jgi:hypothetical protein
VNRTLLVIMGVMVLALGVGAAVLDKKKEPPKPEQEIARALLVPTERERRVIVPPCGTGVPVASIDADELATTPGSVALVLKKGRGDRILLVPRCTASQGAQASEGANLPSAVFVLPVGANIDAGRGGSVEAGTELVQSQLVVPANSPVKTVVVPRCIESREAAEATATGRSVILDPSRAERDTALAAPC